MRPQSRPSSEQLAEEDEDTPPEQAPGYGNPSAKRVETGSFRIKFSTPHLMGPCYACGVHLQVAITPESPNLPMTQLLNDEAQRAHKTRNQIHTALLLGGLAVLLAIPTTLLFGVNGLIVTAVAIAALTFLAPRMPPAAVMRLYGAREITLESGSELAQITDILARRADLPARPRLFLIPSPTLNAFATGSRSNAAIGLTAGLVRQLSLRELAGVIAHEISHIHNNDLWVMSIADLMSRFTLAMSYTAVFLAVMNFLALMTTGASPVSWLAIAVLYLAPMLSSLLQLGLSRAREYDADLEGAMLTGDPAGLASALQKLDRLTGRFWEDMMMPMPGRRMPQPSVLRTHPRTEDRVARLRELDPRRTLPKITVRDIPLATLIAPGRIGLRARYRFPGIWY